ncbi:purine and uridine phosphorylase [Aspergillus granulosus]|uniref:Purine and uridine phosphorylase n=1 Tax=Aspergillus granulosus TaxID=176169 RepID=A0ABR4HC89_9EURO
MTEPLRTFTHDDYTVGWICALPETELVAAAAMLDEEHAFLPAADVRDANSYILGRIGTHNVVVACLPAETTGKASAATVAKDMLRSFPAVRFALVVGIGGGAPYYGAQSNMKQSATNLTRRVLMSTEAVVQYDFGKSVQERGFVRTGGKLNKPPAILLSAVALLKQQHKRKGNTLLGLMAEALSKNPGISEDFGYPGPAKDRLFKSSVAHANGRKSCKACCGSDNINLVRRPDRSQTSPEIHYGTIGSADQVMKDGLLRDRWAQEEKIICFEMEAAGLMDSFPCLVIRGICDYADSHKNKTWQPYAAITAASYAKDLLLVIPGQSVTNLIPIKQILGMISMTEAKVDMVRSKWERKEDYDILNWITAIDYGPQQSDYFRRRQDGTGQWLISSAEFQQWLRAPQKTLFCPGIPGAGKTILTSIVINHITKHTFEENNIGVAYLYCNFQRKDDQRIEDLLSSLLKQLAERQTSLPGEVKELYNQHKHERTRPAFEDIASTLHEVIVKYSRVFIVIDALDECQTSEGCRTKLLSEIFKLQIKCGINIFATSRINAEIEKLFCDALSLEIRAKESDVELYLDKRMQLQQLDTLDNDLKAEIKRRVVDATAGM